MHKLASAKQNYQVEYRNQLEQLFNIPLSLAHLNQKYQSKKKNNCLEKL